MAMVCTDSSVMYLPNESGDRSLVHELIHAYVQGSNYEPDTKQLIEPGINE